MCFCDLFGSLWCSIANFGAEIAIPKYYANATRFCNN